MDELGDDGLAAVCRENLAEEIAMADRLKAELPGLTGLFLNRADARMSAAGRPCAGPGIFSGFSGNGLRIRRALAAKEDRQRDQ